MGIIEIVKRQAMQQSRLEGQCEKAIAIAREMKKDGVAFEQIAKFTNLSIKEIEKL